MKKIWKTHVDICFGKFRMQLPHMAKILSLQMQEKIPVIWHSSDVHETKSDIRVFEWFPTGATWVPDNSIHIGTVQLRNGLVFHLFEL